MKEERRRQKQLEVNFEEEYFEDHGGRIVHRGSGAVVAETEYELSEATKGLTKLDLRELELKDMEVARKLQEEEIKASKMHAHAAQVAKDEVSGHEVCPASFPLLSQLDHFYFRITL
uniref:Uncharacterized protein n=1 Tax=Monopterus albus TaxID=43700 RepID=A0A3Q3KA39_MONAL